MKTILKFIRYSLHNKKSALPVVETMTDKVKRRKLQYNQTPKSFSATDTS